MKITSSFAKLVEHGMHKVFVGLYNEISVLYNHIFTGMTEEDKKAKKWIEKFMKKYG